MADRMRIYPEDTFRERRKRGRRAPGISQPTTTNWRQKWSQMSEAIQPILSRQPSYQRPSLLTQPVFEQSRYSTQLQNQSVVDLTEDNDDDWDDRQDHGIPLEENDYGHAAWNDGEDWTRSNRQRSRSAQDIKRWLKDQPFDHRTPEQDFEVNVPDSQVSSTLEDSVPISPILDQRAHQLKLDQKERFARIAQENTRLARSRYQPEKRRKITHPLDMEEAFDPYQPPSSMQPRVRFHDTHLAVEELQRAHQEEEERLAAKLAHDRQKLLEQDEMIRRARQEENEALLRIQMDEAKAAREEQHRARMAEMEERQCVVNEKLAQQKSEEERRKAAEAEKERRAKRERDAAAAEEVRNRTIQARKEAELAKAKREALKAVVREELKAPLPSQQQSVGVTIPPNLVATLGGTLPSRPTASDEPAANSRTLPRTPSDRRREIEEAKARTAPREPYPLSEKDLAAIANREQAIRQAAAQQEKEEKRQQKEHEKIAKELRREVKRKEKEAKRAVHQENRPRKRPVKLPKPGTIAQQPPEAAKKTFGGFLEEDSASQSESPSEPESDEDALFCSASKEGTDIYVHSPRGPNTAFTEQYVSRAKSPDDCPDLRIDSPTGPASSTRLAHTHSSCASLLGGSVTSSTKVTKRPHAPQPKFKQLNSPNAAQQVPDPNNDRSRTGGKSMNPQAIAAYLDSLQELRGSDEEDADIESDVEEIVQSRERRQDSPLTERDLYHWNYTVLRKTWHPQLEEEAAQWIVCGKTGYSSLQQANAMADREAMRKRHGYSLQPSNPEWARNLNKHGMVQIYMNCTNTSRKPGFVKIKVDRQLRTTKSGIRPGTKFGWINATVWEIRKTTSTTILVAPPPEDDSDNDLFEERSPEVESETETMEEIEIVDDFVYSNVDEANRTAAKLVLDIVVPKPLTKGMDEALKYEKRRQEELDDLTVLCDTLAQDEEAFEAEVEVGGASIKIQVVGRELKGPRNI